MDIRALCACVFACASFALRAAEPISVQPLAATDVREVTAVGGQQHDYRLTADARRAWRVVTEEVGIDLVLAPADGTPFASRPSQYARDALLFLPGEPREFSVRVLGEAERGTYRIRVEPFPASGGAVTAQRRYEAAARASVDGQGASVEQKRAALPLWTEAAGAWQAARRPREQAEAELSRCQLLRDLREQPAADAACQAALRLARTAGHGLLTAQVANVAALVAHGLRRSTEAETLLREALTLAGGDARTEASVRSNLGLVLHNTGDLPAAVAEYRAALVIYQRLGLRTSQARLANNLGGIHYQRGETAEAERLLRSAAAEYAALGDRGLELNSLGNVALVLRNRGDLKGALTVFRTQLAGYRELGDPEGEGYALSHLGTVYAYLGEYARAEELLGRALVLRRAANDRRGEYATARQLARVRHLLGEESGVLELIAAAETQAREAKDRSASAGLRAVRAEVLGARQPDAALAEFRAVAAAYAEIGDARQEALAVLAAGSLELAAGRNAEARADAEHALARVAGRGLAPVEAQAHQLLARAAAAAGDTAAAGAANARALALVEAQRARIATPELRAVWTATVRDVYELAVELRLAAHRATGDATELVAAFELAERMRARAFLELFQAPPPRPGWRTAGLRARFEALQAELNARTAAALDGRPAAESAEIAAELDGVTAELHAADPVYAGLRAPRVLRYVDLARALGGDTVLLHYLVGERSGWVFIADRSGLRVQALPGRATLETLVRRVADAWSRRVQGVDVGADAGRLTALLVPALPAGARIALVADGPLEYLPFAALPVGGREPLVARHELVMLPSASAWLAQREEHGDRPPAARLLAVVADPVLNGEGAGSARRRDGSAFEPLPGTRAEAEALVGLAGRGQVSLALGAAATRERVLAGALAGHRIVHLATHGVVDSRLPVQSGLVLSGTPDGGGGPGFLDLNDVAGLALDAELVVLSACDTALGREVRGEGLTGLTRGFMQAGARSVAATLWRVPDRATAEFMRRFYAHLLRDGATPAAALRSAQLEMRSERRWRDPHHWAAFTLHGDWNLPAPLNSSP